MIVVVVVVVVVDVAWGGAVTTTTVILDAVSVSVCAPAVPPPTRANAPRATNGASKRVAFIGSPEVMDVGETDDSTTYIQHRYGLCATCEASVM